eukprot:gene7681-15725_t
MSSKDNGKSTTVSIMIIFGSGGHTSEMLKLIAGFEEKRYSPAYFVLAQSDITSMDKIKNTEQQLPFKQPQFLRISRSREVKQSWLSSFFTTLLALFESIGLILKYKPQLILCNGPGTCVPICFAAWLARILFIYKPHIIFVESFCRVETLSLSGKLLYYIADKFVVQWPELASKYDKAEYIGKIF